jgi:hypothetical protein
MKAPSPRTLKPLYLKWLVLLAVLDVIVVLLFVAPELIDGITLTKMTVMRVLGTAVLPVVVLLLTGPVPADVKAILVFWKVANPLPGSGAFTKYGPADPRIDMASLKKNIGVFPSDPYEQNKKWYGLYQLVVGDVAVVEAHKLFLMYRDMATASLPLIVLVPLGLRFAGASAIEGWIASGFFVVQYVATALSARHSGNRLVCNVLAVHSTRKVTPPTGGASQRGRVRRAAAAAAAAGPTAPPIAVSPTTAGIPRRDRPGTCQGAHPAAR